MKWIGTQTIYDNIRLSGNAGNVSVGDGTGTLSLTAGTVALTISDATLYDATNDGNPTINIGSSATNRLQIASEYHSGAQTMNWAKFTTYSSSGSTNAGRFGFYVDEVVKFGILDAGINIAESNALQIGGVDILTDSSGTTTLNNIDDLDATTIATFNSHLTAGDITGVTAGTNLTGGGSSGDVTINLADASTSAKGAARFSSDNFAVSSGTVTIKSGGIDLTDEVTGVLPSANMDSDTAHLSGTQTFTGTKTFPDIIIDGDKNITPAIDGSSSMIHLDTSTLTDTNTSEGGTALGFASVVLEGPTISASNSEVSITDAATVYIKSGPTAGTNVSLSNILALWIDAGTARFDGDIKGTGGNWSLYDAVNDGNPAISTGSSANNRVAISSQYHSGAQTLETAEIQTYTTGSSTDDGKINFKVDEVYIGGFLDDGLNLAASMNLSIGGVDILDDSSGTTTLKNIDALDATTESTIESAIDTLSNLTTTGTIGTGVWQGTAIATDQQKHLAWFEIAGFGTGDGTNYDMSANLDDTKAPFEHDVSIGSAGTTAITVQNIIRSGGTVMPRAGTLKKWTGWATTAGSSTSNIALFKITPTRNNNSNVAPVLIHNFSYTALGNAKAEDFAETSFTDADLAAGDIIVSGIKCENNKATYFSSTIEIEWD